MPRSEIQALSQLDALAQRYIDHVRVNKRLASRTVAMYTEDLLKLQGFCAKFKIDLLQVQELHVRRMIAHMHSKGRSARGIALIMSGWRGFYVWLVSEKLISANPAQDVPLPKAAKPLPKSLSREDATQLMMFSGLKDAANFDAALEARDAALTETLYGSGLRVAELVNLDICSSPEGRLHAKGYIDLPVQEVSVIGKGSKSRVVPLSKKSIEAIERWLPFRANMLLAAKELSDEDLDADPSSPLALFIAPTGKRLSTHSVWKNLKSRAAQAGLAQHVHPHVLRHSFASHLLQGSQDIRAVQELLGHENISTTQVYTRLDFAHLANVYDQAHPRARR